MTWPPAKAANPVLLVLVLIGAAALAGTGLVAHAPNRLLSGSGLPLWRVADLPVTAAIVVIGAGLLAAAFLPPTRLLHAGVIAAAAAMLLLVLWGAGAAASALAAASPAAARTSLGAAFWIASLCASLAIVDALQRLGARPGTRLLVAGGIAALIALLAASGRLDALSILREYANRRGAFLGELARHCELVIGALVPALVIGVPLGLMAARRPASRGALFATLNFIQTIPSIAIFGLMIAPLAALSAALPALAALGVHGIGVAPALIALILYSLLPVVRNTEAGIRGVDPAVIETASGMGMTGRQIFRRVELPLGLPVFLAGVRIVTVQAIGLAVVAALIGAGGLGTFVFQGLGQYAIDLVLLGAVPTIFLALTADFVLAMAIESLNRRSAS
jgi:osmoprotectant transport system permease protein